MVHKASRATWYNFTFFLLLLLFKTMALPAGAVGLPDIFGSHMVLQQQAEVTIWGWGKPQEGITVTGSWDTTPVKTHANNLAQWKVQLKTPEAGGPYTVKVQGYNTIVFEDVLIGEVWLCSGQSNMEWSANMGIDNAKEEIKNASYPTIRFFSVPHRTADATQLNSGGEWVVCSPETMANFSAIGYFFGRELQQKLNVPVGVINSSWGGTPAEVWATPESIESNNELAATAAKLSEMAWGPKDPGKAYHAMIAPLIPYKIAGALWYQGETNTGFPEVYAQLLPALIKGWRGKWGYEFPFYFVQIAPWKYGRVGEGVLLRDAQRKSLVVPNTGMVVISDIGDIENIHPGNKKDVGKRLANWALNKTYGKSDVAFSGPLYREMKIEDKSIRIFFDHAENGLLCKGKNLTHFEIAGDDQRFVQAQARIEGGTIVVQAKGVKEPKAVRFAWSNTAEPNLFNKEGLPASCFRTDDWPIEIK